MVVVLYSKLLRIIFMSSRFGQTTNQRKFYDYSVAYFGISNFVQYVNVFTDNNTQVHKIQKDNIINNNY